MRIPVLKRILLAGSLLLSASCVPVPGIPVFQQKGYPDKVKVGIFQDMDKAEISVKGPFALTVGSNKDKAQKYEKGATVRIIKTEQGLQMNDIVTQDEISFCPESEKTLISVNNRPYRGEIILSLNSAGTMDVINELGIEEYLCGTMKAEISPGWPFESLKAQAVVSRTYTLQNLGKYRARGFDLSSTTSCQVYAGLNGETARTNRAVRETKGQVITYGGELINAFYHSNSGGMTEDVSRVWGMQENPPPYLRGRASPYCRNSPHYQWSFEESKESIEEALNRGGYDIKGIKKIRIKSRSRSRRVAELLIHHSRGTTEIQANKFRSLVGTDKLRSTLFSIADKGDKIEFSGRGWGHGVGMSQWGAKEMASRGFRYREIIKFYFPGTQIEKLK